MEPVAVAVRSSSEVWVVNHLSDSVSIVDVGVTPARVKRTLLVGDEPRDIVFAGAGGSRAFITTARRGQQLTNSTIAGVPGAGDPQLTTPGEPRASVWVFDASNLGNALGGTPLEIVHLFSDVPRALAKSPDGSTVYAAAFPSGNQTHHRERGRRCATASIRTRRAPGRRRARIPAATRGRRRTTQGEQAPDVGIVVKRQPRKRPLRGRARPQLGQRDQVQPARPGRVRDQREHACRRRPPSRGVGTTLFNMVVNPISGKVYVSNTESINDVRFEGPGDFGGSTVQGHLAESRITVLSGSGGAARAT